MVSAPQLQSAFTAARTPSDLRLTACAWCFGSRTSPRLQRRSHFTLMPASRGRYSRCYSSRQHACTDGRRSHLSRAYRLRPGARLRPQIFVRLRRHPSRPHRPTLSAVLCKEKHHAHPCHRDRPRYSSHVLTASDCLFAGTRSAIGGKTPATTRGRHDHGLSELHSCVPSPRCGMTSETKRFHSSSLPFRRSDQSSLASISTNAMRHGSVPRLTHA